MISESSAGNRICWPSGTAREHPNCAPYAGSTCEVARLSAQECIPSVHPLTGTELRALHRLQREQEPGR